MCKAYSQAQNCLS